MTGALLGISNCACITLHENILLPIALWVQMLDKTSIGLSSETVGVIAPIAPTQTPPLDDWAENHL